MPRKFAVPILVIVLAGASAMALAAVETKSGDIKTLDTAKQEIVLTSGEIFNIPASIQLKNFKVGEKVTIAYEMKNGKMEATKVEAAK
jgi:uncharacterized protein DUF1344